MLHRDLRTKILLIGFTVGCIHICAGIAVLVHVHVLDTTALSGLKWALDKLEFSDQVGALILLAAGVMAISASVVALESKLTFAWLFALQELLLIFQTGSVATAVILGVYPDGYVPRGGSWFILVDQSWAWTLAISHSSWLAVYLLTFSSQKADVNR